MRASGIVAPGATDSLHFPRFRRSPTAVALSSKSRSQRPRESSSPPAAPSSRKNVRRSSSAWRGLPRILQVAATLLGPPSLGPAPALAGLRLTGVPYGRRGGRIGGHLRRSQGRGDGRLFFGARRNNDIVQGEAEKQRPQGVPLLDSALGGDLPSCLATITGIETDASAWALASLPVRLGGLGLHSCADTAAIAHIAATFDGEACLSSLVTPYVLPHAMLLNEDDTFLASLEDPRLAPFDSVLEKIQDVLQARDNYGGRGQKVWSTTVHGERRKALLDSMTEELGRSGQLQGPALALKQVQIRARIQSCSGQHASAWLYGNAEADPRLWLSPAELAVAIRLRLGLPIAPMPSICRLCGTGSTDVDGVHARSCFSGGRRTRMHNALRDVIADFARRGLLAPAVERPVFSNTERKRPDISYVRDGTTVVLDVAVTFPLQPSNPQYAKRAAEKPGGAATAYATAVKEGKYRGIIDNEPNPREWLAVPLVVDTFGAWCPGALTELRQIARKSALREDRTASAACQDFFHQLSFQVCAPERVAVYAAESLEGWRSRPQFKALGELLLRELRIEFLCAQGGFSREEFRMHMQLESEDPLDRAVAKLWLERRGFDGGCSSGTGGGVRGRKRRIPPAVRRRRKRDQRQSMPPTTVSPPQSSDGPLPRSHVRYHDPHAAPVQARCARLVPLLPARCTAPRGDASGDDTLQLPPQSIGNPPHSINFAGVSLVGHHPGTARSPDSRESHSSPIAGEPPAQRLGAASDPQSDAARDPAGATTCGYAAHDIGHGGGVGLGSTCPDAQRLGPVEGSLVGHDVACSGGALRPGPVESQAEKEAPLHVAAVPAMDTAALRLRMKPDLC
ncbi:hypothetical protein DIPPA_20130 [Diplonema papillatum]|nr:hypothetical protein DIPPA_20130 [Diplonema papillatum]